MDSKSFLKIQRHKEGQIILDSEAGKELGFTSALFDGYLWKIGDRIFISLIVSRNKRQGNLSRLFAHIQQAGYKVAVPTPIGKMVKILKKKGFVPHIEHDAAAGPAMGGAVEVWMLPKTKKSLKGEKG